MAKAVAKSKKNVAKSKPSAPAKAAPAARKALKPPAKPVERLAVKVGSRVVLVKIEELDWIKAADNYVELHRGKETHLLRETMSALETRLPRSQSSRSW